MRALVGELLLEAWERGAAENDFGRALTMLALAMPESSRAQLAEMPVGESNRQLLRLRQLTFGPVLRAFSVCAQCGARLELALPVAQMLARLESQLPEGPAEWLEDGTAYRMRPVNTGDLLASLAEADVTGAQNCVLARCLNQREWREKALEKFDQLNAAAELTCAVQCPECSRAEALELDLAHFLWLEVRHAALRLLDEIHELAGAYGWSEESIVHMSPQRREAYLERLSA